MPTNTTASDFVNFHFHFWSFSLIRAHFHSFSLFLTHFYLPITSPSSLQTLNTHIRSALDRLGTHRGHTDCPIRRSRACQWGTMRIMIDHVATVRCCCRRRRGILSLELMLVLMLVLKLAIGELWSHSLWKPLAPRSERGRGHS